MILRLTCVIVLLVLRAHAFLPRPFSLRPQPPSLALRSSSSGFAGNNAPRPEDISIMDSMIDKLAAASLLELPTAVSASLKVCGSPQFFLRIAERADMSSGPEKESLVALADNLSATLQAVVETSERKLDERAEAVEAVVKAAAEDDGEFMVPLSAARRSSLMSAVASLPASDRDETFVATVDSWMNKANEDGLDGMVVILQAVMQCYAAVEIARLTEELVEKVGREMAEVQGEGAGSSSSPSPSSPASKYFGAVLASNPDSWPAMMADLPDGVDHDAVMGEAQRTIEGVVLGLENGSMRQRVMAEFLREIVAKVEEGKKA
eukprot:CAMPEP_0182467734 /NCGR_PEP_ID=MMETSP1319-20130603/14471_1 /TAXON_ID=172717 /ORGANISM="Bolidomonas pacifica, Strain RCC208" /LENGTH=320 /DNA_ID=CAMNT_0024667857 /DNA_START=57 /DNA_END=1016 /DNA_ORIENTATION=+